MNNLPQLNQESTRTQRTYQSAVILLIVEIVSVFLYFYLALQTGAWQVYALAGSIVVLIVLSFLSMVSARRNQPTWGAIWLLGGLMIIIPVISGLIAGLGIVLGIVGFILITVIGAQILEPSGNRLALGISLVSSVLAIAIDLFKLTPSLSVPILSVYIPFIAIAILAVFGFTFLRNYRDYSLGTKLVLTFLGVSVIPLAAFAYYNNYQTQKNITDSAVEGLGSSANQAAHDLDSFFDEGLANIRTYSQLHILKEYLAIPPGERAGSETEASLYKDLLAITRLDTLYISAVGVIDKNGLDVADTVQGDVGVNKSDRDYFINPKKSGAPYVTPIEFSTINGKPSFYFSAPIFDDAGNFIGVIRMRYDAGVLQQNVKNSANSFAGQNGVAVLFDENFVRIAHSDDPELNFTSVVPLPADKLAKLQAELRMPPGTAEQLSTNLPDTLNGLENVVNQPVFNAELHTEGQGLETSYGVKLKRQPWTLIFGQTDNAFLLPVQAQTRNNTLIALVVTGLVAVIGFFAAQTVSRPVLQLSNVAQEIAGGNLKAQAPVSSRDEIGTLASNFNFMTNQLRETLDGLEQTVANRTKALAATAEVSRKISTILNRSQLVNEVAEQVKSTFNYYHTQIYLFDSTGESLVMMGGTGDAGTTMLSQGHKIPKGRGLVGRAAELNEPVLVSDTSKDEAWLPNPLLPDTASEVAIPISVGNEVLGILDVQHNAVDGLQREDIASLQAIANQVAIALQNIQQYENSQKVANDLGVVANVGIATSTITDIDFLLQEVVDLAKKSFNLYHAHIYMLNEKGDTLQLAAGADEAGGQMVSEGRSIPLNSEQSIVARAARTKQGLVVNDVTVDPNFLPNPLLPNTRSELATPMLVSGNLIGVLDVQSDLVGRFTDLDVNIKTTLASQVAVAVQNARNLEQFRQQAERETTLNMITRQIQSAGNVDSALRIAARELGQALGMKPTMVTLESEKSNGGHDANS